MAIEKAAVDDLIRRVDEMMAELASLRQDLLMILPRPTGASLAATLYGSLGHGRPDEYDSIVDWERFA